MVNIAFGLFYLKENILKVNISFHDRDSFTTEEVIAAARRNYGRNVEVTITPESSKVEDILYLALQSLITQDQLSLFFDNKDTYSKELSKLRTEVMYKVQEVMDLVIVDNETRLTGD
jgi:hypothetical protein